MTSNLVELHVDLVDINLLKPYAMNARAHSRKQVRRIADSIKQFGFTNPLLIDELGEVIAGHGRLQAAQQLKLGQVPVIRLRHLDTAQKRALRLADNRIAELSSWTPELLTSELQFLVETDFAVEVTGFDTIDLDRILTPANAADDPDDAPVPAPPDQPTSRPGDIWRHCHGNLAEPDFALCDAVFTRRRSRFATAARPRLGRGAASLGRSDGARG